MAPGCKGQARLGELGTQISGQAAEAGVPANRRSPATTAFSRSLGTVDSDAGSFATCPRVHRRGPHGGPDPPSWHSPVALAATCRWPRGQGRCHGHQCVGPRWVFRQSHYDRRPPSTHLLSFWVRVDINGQAFLRFGAFRTASGKVGDTRCQTLIIL